MQLTFLNDDVEKLSSGFPEKLVILDLETTGGRATRHRIIEVGLIIIEEGECVEKWQTFVDPETYLPMNIQRLTGIRPEDLEGAPTFRMIADELLDKLTGRTLVAHHARFDYGFLKNEFARIGYSYSDKPLCSVKFSRAMFPQFNRHGLDQIIKRFGFNIENRHRALDDAEMVYQLFQKSSVIFSADDISSACAQILKRPSLPTTLNPEIIEGLPGKPGVYYFYDQNGHLLYIGKSVNIRQRVLSHFNQDYRNPKDLKMSRKIAQIDFVRTPTDFGAQLLESQQIKELMPVHNRQLRKVKKLYQLQMGVSEQGYHQIKPVQIETDADQLDYQFGLFRSRRQAYLRLERMADEFQLCHQLLNLEPKKTHDAPCFRYQLKRCLGACIGEDPIALYNERVQQAMAEYRIKVWPWKGPVIVEERNPEDKEETAYHLLNDWRYLAKLSCPEDAYDYSVEERASFDMDSYFILVRFLMDDKVARQHGLRIHPLAAPQS